MNPENFKAAFISAEGWGSLLQTRTVNSQTNTVKILQGKLNIQELVVALPEGKVVTSIVLTLNNNLVDATVKKEGDKTTIIFESVVLEENDTFAAILKL
jgi:hypothetical protein